ncbi:MAG: molybdopterin-dependent oxidoreductase [Chloroflexi bacterium]|nr:molybdopterin-dependent oxidoreductase [Chloroflexota bacterium]
MASRQERPQANDPGDVALPLLGQPVTRRGFLKGASAGAAALYLTQLGCSGGDDGIRRVVEQDQTFGDWTDVYREKWTWDKVTWGTHLIDCYPGSCLFRVYTKDGIVWREEQAGKYPEVEPGVPDMNPRGCQKGACFSDVMYGPERLRYPLRRVGERGGGKWERITWDEALTDVADGILDAIDEVGPESIIYETGPGNGGIVNGPLPGWRLSRLIGATVLDTNGLVGDFNVGLYETFGKFHFVSSVDDWFHSDLILTWHMNPVYTRIPSAHFIYEARYHGARVVNIAPDYNASSVHADLWVPVEPGTDAALALALCKIIIDEGWMNRDFVIEQTDLPLLVRLDTKHFLRAPDLPDADAGARDDQFYVWDEATGALAPAPRDTLRLKTTPALEGRFEVDLADGTRIEVVPAFVLLRERLQEYTPEYAASVTGTKPSVIRRLARMVGEAKRVHILQGFNINKYYHGDLMERAQALLLALTGNFGRKGTGMRGFNTGQVQIGTVVKDRAGMEGFIRLADRALDVEKELLKEDPTLTEEMRAIGVEQAEAERRVLLPYDSGPLTVPAAFYWYWHAGYKDVWNRSDWSDPSMKRPLGEYLDEAVAKGWWDGVALPPPDKPPRVLLEVAASTLRRTRGGYKVLREKLWPQLKLIVVVDLRMSSTALQADIVLPAAGFYEKTDFRFPTTHVNFLTFTEQAVKPVGEAKPEWELFSLLARKLQERAIARGMESVVDGEGREFPLNELWDRFSMRGALRERDVDALAEDIVRDTVRVGALPERTTLKTFRKEGIVRFTGIGQTAEGLNLATDIKPDETVSPLRWHVEKKLPYPTLTRRIQFYIDHDWFLEADEALPRHKPNPQMGGSHPLKMVSGHLRWSIHSTWVANRLMLQTHRGEPFLMMSPDDASSRGIADGEHVRAYNDVDEFFVKVKLGPAVRPGEVIIYHAWEPYQYKNWKPYDSAIPGMIKWLHLAGGYGHLKYWRNNWQPQQADRAIAIEVEKMAPEGDV